MRSSLSLFLALRTTYQQRPLVRHLVLLLLILGLVQLTKSSTDIYAPQAIVMEPGTHQLFVSFIAPVAINQAPVLRYELEALPGAIKAWSRSLTCTIPGLSNNVEYSVRVRAHFASAIVTGGTKIGGWASSSTFATPTDPAPVLDTTAVGGSKSAYVSWKHDQGNGKAVSSFVIVGEPSFSNVTFEVGPEVRSVVLTNLTHPIYRFQVRPKCVGCEAPAVASLWSLPVPITETTGGVVVLDGTNRNTIYTGDVLHIFVSVNILNNGFGILKPGNAGVLTSLSGASTFPVQQRHARTKCSSQCTL